MNSVSETDRKDALSDQEMERLHANDLQADQIVVELMITAFVVGLLMYAFIFWLAM
jgi:multisubunit Na+/H+ antiporter MnhC subunit